MRVYTHFSHFPSLENYGNPSDYPRVLSETGSTTELVAHHPEPLLCHLRCLRMIGGVTPVRGRMTRSRVAEWGAAATLKPWGTKRAETRTPALRRHLRSPWGPKPWSRPSSDPEISWTHRGTSQPVMTTFLLCLFYISCIFILFQHEILISCKCNKAKQAFDKIRN